MTKRLSLVIRKYNAPAGIILLIIVCLSFIPAYGQTHSIKFEDGTWQDIKAKSIQQKKLIFLDGYASWCGICKKMDKNVFTNDTVADYYNTNFINAKLDMESGEGLALAQQFKVNVYPSFLFIDGNGKVLHRAVGGLSPKQFVELGRAAQDPNKQNALANSETSIDPGVVHQRSNRTELGFNISQYQRDFGIGLHVISPYFFGKFLAIKAGTNFQWFENAKDSLTTWSAYQNIQIGMRNRRTNVTDNISVYGEGGMFIILPNSEFSSKSSVVGGFGLIGFEFRITQAFAYFLELGGVGTGATADKVAGKPIYSNGFLTNVGFKVGL